MRTIKDIYLAAHKAAEALVDVTAELELQTKKLAAFSESQLGEADFPIFDAHFNERRNVLKSLDRHAAPSATETAKPATPTASAEIAAS